MWSLFAPLGKPSTFSSGLYNYWKCATQRQLSQLTRRKHAPRPWTAEDERKLCSLVQQGFGLNRIASEMTEHSFTAIEFRLTSLQAGDNAARAESKIKRRYWTAEEKALILEKQRQGLSIQGIASYFPYRSYISVRRCVTRLEHWPVSTRQTSDFTEEDLQRVIGMKSKGKTLGEIAHEMQCSRRTIEALWQYRCRSMVTKESLQSIRWSSLWTAHEEEHLVELHRRGTISISDAARQFPSRTAAAVRMKIMRMRLTFSMVRDRK